MKLIVPAAVHPNALHATNTNELNAYIIAAIALLGKVYQFLSGGGERRAMAGNSADVFACYGVMQAIGALQQNVAGEDLIFAGIDAEKHMRA